jgi:hypothetical protein
MFDYGIDKYSNVIVLLDVLVFVVEQSADRQEQDRLIYRVLIRFVSMPNEGQHCSTFEVNLPSFLTMTLEKPERLIVPEHKRTEM